MHFYFLGNVLGLFHNLSVFVIGFLVLGTVALCVYFVRLFQTDLNQMD